MSVPLPSVTVYARRIGPKAWPRTARFLHLKPRKRRCRPGRGNHLLYEVFVEPRHSTVGGPQDESPHLYAVDFTLKKKLLQRPTSVAPAAEWRHASSVTLGDGCDVRHSLNPT
jgi:hypothetical protein